VCWILLFSQRHLGILMIEIIKTANKKKKIIMEDEW